MQTRIRVAIGAALIAVGILALVAFGLGELTPSRPTEAGTLAAATAEASPTASAVPSPETSPIASLSPKPSTAVVRTGETRKPTRAPRPTTRATIPAKPKVYRLAPVTAYFSQRAIDQCKLVLFGTNPTNLIAAHNNCGYGWLDNIPTGSTVIVTVGPAQGTYRVVGHKWIGEKGGRAPAWLGNYDLVLQTCTDSGTGFSVAQRVS